MSFYTGALQLRPKKKKATAKLLSGEERDTDELRASVGRIEYISPPSSNTYL